MLKLKESFFADCWFSEPLTEERQQAIRARQICAILREDGDEDAALIQAIRGVDAPVENTRITRIENLRNDTVITVVWDDRFVLVEDD